MLYCIIAIVAILVGVYVGRQIANKEVDKINEDIKKKNEEIDQQYQQKVKELNNFTEELSSARNKAISDNSQFLGELEKQSQQALAREEERRQEFERKTEAFEDLKYKEWREHAEDFKQYLYDQANLATIDLKFQKCQLENEIETLSASRDALIQASKREEELKLQTDFHKIQVSQKDLDDIQLLKSIELHLHNPEPLYKLIWSSFYQKPTKELLGRIIGAQKTSGIYKITNLLDGRIYIGQSVDVANRLTDHIKASLGIGTISHQKIHDVMNEKGLENFSFELVETCDKSALNTKEKLWIKTYQSDTYGYNQTAGGS